MLRRQSASSARLRLLQLLAIVPVALAPFMLFGFISVASFEHGLLPHYQERAEIVASSVDKRLEYGARLFGDLRAIRDIGAILDEAKATSEEVAFIAVVNPDGDVVGQSPADFDQLAGILTAGRTAAHADWNEAIERPLDAIYHSVFGTQLFDDATDKSYQAGHFLITRLEVGDPEKPLGAVVLGTDIELLARVRDDVVFDAGTIFIAALLIGMECLLLLFAINLTRPQALLRFLTDRLAANDLRYTVAEPGGGRLGALVREVNAFIAVVAARAARYKRARRDFSVPEDGKPRSVFRPAANYIRLPLFLFFLSEAILRPSLPLFLSGLPSPVAVGSDQQAGIAMAFFLLASIGGVVAGSTLVERMGLKPALLTGAIISAAGTLAHVAAADIVQAGALRAVAGFGYGVVYSAAQLYVVQHTETHRRTSGFSFFLIVVVGAEVSGPAVGGVLADRLGADAAFIAAATAMSLSILIAAIVLPNHLPDLLEPRPAPAAGVARRGGAFRRLAGHGRFLTLILCFSIPSKLLLNGGLFLLIPLTVTAGGFGATEAGRVIMVYGLVILLVAGPLARMADRWMAFGPAIVVGTMLSGLGFVLPELLPYRATLYAAVALFGLGQALSIPSQMSYLLRLTQDEVRTYGPGPVMGQFRFFERLGSLIGPLAGAALLTVAGPGEALLILGAGAMLISGAGAAGFLIVGEQREEDAIDALLVRH